MKWHSWLVFAAAPLGACSTSLHQSGSAVAAAPTPVAQAAARMGLTTWVASAEPPLPADSGWMLPGLPAEGPNPALRDKLMLFGQFVGDWTISSRFPRPDGSEIRGTGALHVRWILEGRALQDIFSVNRGDPPRETPVGTTVRYYDEKIDAWHVVWLSPYQGVERAFVARRVGEEIVLQGTTPEGYPERWIFSDITPESFRWHSEETHDHGATWLLTEESRMLRVRRRD